MFNINQHKNQIEQLCKQLSVQKLELFGSAVRKDFSDTSDIDLFYEFRGTDNLLHRFFTLKRGLEQIFERKVDLVKEEALTNPYIKQDIAKNKREVIYGS